MVVKNARESRPKHKKEQSAIEANSRYQDQLNLQEDNANELWTIARV